MQKKERSILVTGGSGYLGHHLVRELLNEGWERICVFSRGEHRQAEMRHAFHDDKRLRWMIGDVRDLARLRRAMHGCEVVVHAAALKRIEIGEYDPGEMAATNVLGSKNVIEAAIDTGLARAVLVSSDKAVAPRNCYGATKLVAEKLFSAAPALSGHRLSSCIVRYGNVAGSTGSVIPQWRSTTRPTMTDPECTRFWLSARQAVELVLRGIRWSESLIVPSLPAFRLGDLASAMDINPEVTGLPPGEKLHETLDGVTDSSQARRLGIQELKQLLARLTVKEELYGLAERQTA